MNQRLFVILAIILVLVGVGGILFSGNETVSSETDTNIEQPQEPLKDVTYYVTERAMAAGEIISENDVQHEVEKVPESELSSIYPREVVGLYLTEPVAKGIRLTSKNLTNERPKETDLNKGMFRFSVPLNTRYANNILGIVPGDKVDVYLRFSSPKREQHNKSVIFRGESVVKITRLFKHKKVLTPLMKGNKAVVEEENKERLESEHLLSRNKLFSESADFTIDIELSRTDLKKLYQIENGFEIILFPAETLANVDDSALAKPKNKNKGGK
ncbi:hypothetical protein HGT71_14590 [Rosenbergiella epipactidis]|uniref:hypothetical protein n=1 Tax=Rosenbergiella epipactidis TaxID=1544694 RepID=UPI001BD9FAD0|nr:hypothetical protein [Rosenbergiella epipactidis]MBT0719472.1 hypothetical protein [Rosenbergiella epipactidis]